MRGTKEKIRRKAKIVFGFCLVALSLPCLNKELGYAVNRVARSAPTAPHKTTDYRVRVDLHFSNCSQGLSRGGPLDLELKQLRGKEQKRSQSGIFLDIILGFPNPIPNSWEPAQKGF
jgi:hypothetical protein